LADGSTTRAVAEFVDRYRTSLQCLAAVEVFGTGDEIGRQHSLGFVAHSRAATDRASLPLTSPQGVVSFLLRVYVEYRVDVSTNLRVHRVSATSYSYRLLTSEHRELVAFPWHPSGLSRFTTPHLHVAGAAPIPLPALHSAAPRSLDIAKAHLPTHPLSPEDLVELLIDDPVFGIEPRRIDWRGSLSRNRALTDDRGNR